jgi:hypothetical protein
MEAHGHNSVALKLKGTSSQVNGRVLAVGSKVTAVEVDGVANSEVLLDALASVEAASYGSNLPSDFNFSSSLDDPLANGATGVKISDDNQATVKGVVMAKSLMDPRMPLPPGGERAIAVGLDLAGARSETVVDGGQVTSDGYGALLQGANSSLTLADRGALSGALYSIFVNAAASNADILLKAGSQTFGRIKADPAVGATLEAQVGSSIIATDYNEPVVDGVDNLQLNGSIVFATGDLPAPSQTIKVADNYGAGSSFNYSLDFMDGGVLDVLQNQGQIKVLGLKSGLFRSPNAPGVYEAWREASLGTGLGKVFLTDADNLTHEPFVAMAAVGLDAYRQNVGLARRSLFPGEVRGSVFAAPAYMNAKPSGSGSRTAALASLYEQSVSRGVLANWFPADPRTRSFVDGGAAQGLAAAPSSGEFGFRPRLIMDFFHQHARRDDDGYSGYHQDRNGLIMGAAVDLTESFSLGGFFGWSQGDVDFSLIRAKAEVDSWFGGLMGRWRHQISEVLATRLTGQVSLTRAENDLERTLIGQGGAVAKTYGSFRQTIFGAGLETALDWAPFDGPNTVISPWASLDYARLDQDGLNETGNLGVLNLGADKIKADAFFTSIGAALAHDFVISDRTALTVKASAAWERQFGDRRFSADGWFKSGGPRFNARSLQMDRNAAVLGLTLDSAHKLPSGAVFGLSVGYETRLMRHGRDQQYSAGFEVRF